MVREFYDRSANFVARVGAWGLEQVGHGLEAANKRLFNSRAHDGGNDNPSVKRSRGNRRAALGRKKARRKKAARKKGRKKTGRKKAARRKKARKAPARRRKKTARRRR